MRHRRLGGEVWQRGWAHTHKKCLQSDNFVRVLTQFLTGRKHERSLEALGHAFYGTIAERSLQKQCENYLKNHSQTRGRSHHFP